MNRNNLKPFRHLVKKHDDGRTVYGHQVEQKERRWGLSASAIDTAKKDYKLSLYDKHDNHGQILSPVKEGKHIFLIEISPYGRAFGFSFSNPKSELFKQAEECIEEFYSETKNKEENLINNLDLGVQQWQQGTYGLVGWAGRFKTRKLVRLYVRFFKKAIEQMNTENFAEEVKRENPEFL